jgi:16S rRNA (cytosine967-C5)-methyltransferase
MTPSARLQAAIDILTELERTNAPADRFMREWFRARRYAGSKDRASVGERVFSVFRHRASFAWRMQSDAPRALVIASVLAEFSSAPTSPEGRSKNASFREAFFGRGERRNAFDGDGAAPLPSPEIAKGDVDLPSGEVSGFETLFSGEGYGAATLSEEERAAIAAPARESPPLHVQGEFPAWLEPELARSLGENLLAEMRALCERAPVDLRVNTLKATRADALQALRAEGFSAEPTNHAATGIRMTRDEKLSALSKSPLFEQGCFEFQDEAAQIAALLCAAKPGESILDLAAGAGGKALALAALMQNAGEIVACDIDGPRLSQLAPRATRAGASVIRTQLLTDAPPAGTFDAVLVDAPCSGTGTWRRQPELRWRLTAERLAELNRAQDALLDTAAARAPGRIIYATCSLLKSENEDRIGAFLERHAAFRLRPAAEVWREETGTQPPSGMDHCFNASPWRTGTDGFFAAVLERKN